MYKYIIFSFPFQSNLKNQLQSEIHNLSRIKKENILYIGRNIQDMETASKARVDFGLALWECNSIQHIYAKYYFRTPEEISYILDRNENEQNELPWLKWAVELQFISQAGITYSKDAFDVERFERLREISAEIMQLRTGFDLDHIKNVFCNEEGFQTPKLDTRAAIFRENKILLVKEKDEKWSLPGGWVDVNQTIRNNTIKEVKEEAGLDVFPRKIIAIQDRNMHNVPVYAYGICKIFVLCDIIGGNFTSNIETIESNFFPLEELPPMAEDKNTIKQVELCFKAHNDPNWEVIFD